MYHVAPSRGDRQVVVEVDLALSLGRQLEAHRICDLIS
jgi:hypothetical protein